MRDFLAVRDESRFWIATLLLFRWLNIAAEMHGVEIVGDDAVQFRPIAHGVGFIRRRRELFATGLQQ